MPVKKGSKLQRTPQPDRTRSDAALTPDLRSKCIIALEEADTADDPSVIASRYKYFGEPNTPLCRAVCRRITKLRKLKQEDETAYW